MVIRSRRRRLLIPVVLYAAAAGIVGYFVYHAQYGNRGVETKLALKQQIVDLQAKLDDLKEERTDWDRRVTMLRADNLDRDLLDERARVTLNRLHRNDVVIFLAGPEPARP